MVLTCLDNLSPKISLGAWFWASQWGRTFYRLSRWKFSTQPRCSSTRASNSDSSHRCRKERVRWGSTTGPHMPQPFSMLAIAIAAWQSLLHWWCFIPVRAMPQKPLHNKVKSWGRWRVTLQHANSIQLHQTITGLHCSLRCAHGRSWKIVVPLKVQFMPGISYFISTIPVPAARRQHPQFHQ